MGSKKRTGNYAEELALAYLKKKKYVYVDKNVRYPRGEIDIIMKDGDEYVFVEVKSRTGDLYGPPEDAITPYKKGKLKYLADRYLCDETPCNVYGRFDVVSVVFNQDMRVEHITHYENAFQYK